MHGELSHQPSYDPRISGLFFAICLVIPVTIFLALLFYGEPFHLWRDAFSQLGETITPSGNANIVSRLIFSTGWMTSGVLMAMICVRFAVRRDLTLHRVKSGLAFLGAVGFFIATTPNNLNHLVHSIGMGIEVGVMYFFSMILLIELRSCIRRSVFSGQIALLHAAVLTYAATFIANSDSKQLAQKLCILGLLLVMGRMITIAPEGFEWRSTLARLRRS